MSVGMIGYFGLGVESSTTQDSAAIVDYIAITAETLAARRADLVGAGLTQKYDEEETYNGLVAIGGTVTMEPHPTGLGYFLRSAFDSTSTAVCSPTANAWYGLGFSHATWRGHQFIAKQTVYQVGSGSDLPCLTFEVSRGPAVGVGSAFVYYNCCANGMELGIDAGGIMRASFDFIGREYGRKAQSTPSFPTPKAFVWAQASVSVSGVGKAHFESLTVRLNNALSPFPRLDQKYRNAIIRRTGFRTVEINGSLTFSDDTDYDLFTNGSESNLTVTFTLPTSEMLVIKAPAFRYATFEPNLNGPGRIAVPFTGRAMWHAGSGTPLEVVLFNSRLSPYTVNSNG